MKDNFKNKKMDLHLAIQTLEKTIENPRIGLPEDIFFFISRLTAMVNVDLLVRDKHKGILLSWRDTVFSGAGWHVPGGIIRFKESLEERIKQVALSELGTQVEYNPVPIAINQIEKSHKTRGHFISFLFNCYVSDDFIPDNSSRKPTDSGYLQWHQNCPDNLIKVHNRLYREFIETPSRGNYKDHIPYWKIDE
jgi:colanic acid biosynthesis protein WcaH